MTLILIGKEELKPPLNGIECSDTRMPEKTNERNALGKTSLTDSSSGQVRARKIHARQWTSTDADDQSQWSSKRLVNVGFSTEQIQDTFLPPNSSAGNSFFSDFEEIKSRRDR